MKILLAEDEPVMAMTIAARLKNDGYEVVTANDGREALKELENFTPDLIITDILMPYTSGLELIGIIKSTPAQKNIPILVLSSFGQEATVMEAFQLGADDFLTKPLNPLELSVRVKRLLNSQTVE
jgi:two-component system response regulator VicR